MSDVVVPFGLRAKTFGWGLGLGLLIGGVGAGKIAWDAHLASSAAEEAHTEAMAGLREGALAKQEELDRARARTHLLEGRVAIHRADAELAKGNFGVAAEHAAAAFQAVDAVGSDPAGLDRERVAGARAALDGLAIAPTADVAGERARLAVAAAALDAALTSKPPTAP